MAARLKASEGRSATVRRASWFSAALWLGLLASSPTALGADADPGVRLPGLLAFDSAAGWSGFYVGMSAGGGLASASTLKTVPSPEVFGLFGPLTDTELNSLSSNLRSSIGALGGAQVGFNHRTGRFLVGAEADFSLTNMRDRSDFSKTVTTDLCSGTPVPICLPAAFKYDVDSRHKLPWVATARARLGYLATERMLVYATGGLALGSVHTKATATLSPAGGLLPEEIHARYTGERRGTRIGAALGGGMEYAWTDGISLKAEYLYVNLGSKSSVVEPDGGHHDVVPLPGNTGSQGPVNTSLSPPSVPGAAITMRDKSEFHSVRIGINFHF